MTEAGHRLSPEERELRKKHLELDELQRRLAQRELELATLQVELRLFETRYFHVVAARFAELDELEASIAELEAELHPHDPEARERARAAREQAEASASEAGCEPVDALSDRFVPTEQLKTLFREVARRVHPDLAADEPEREQRERLMAEVNRAYARGDEARLQQLLREWEMSPEAVKGDGIGAELVRAIRRIARAEDRILAIDTEMCSLAESDLYRLRRQAEDASSEGRDLLEETAADLDRQAAGSRERLERLKRGDAAG